MTRKRNRKTRKTKKARVRSKMSKRVRGGMRQARGPPPPPPLRIPSQKIESKTNGSATAPSALNPASLPASNPATTRPELKARTSSAKAESGNESKPAPPKRTTSVGTSGRSTPTPRGSRSSSRSRGVERLAPVEASTSSSTNRVIETSQSEAAIERFNTLYSQLQPDAPEFYDNVRKKFEEIETINGIDSLQTFVDLLLCLAKKLKNDQEQEQEPIFITEQIYNVFNQQGRGLMSGARTKLACANVFTVDPPECTGDRAPLTKDELKGFILATIEAIRSYQPAQTQSGIESLEQRPFTNPSLQRDIQGSLG
jgi:hypothetical protein